MKNDTIFVIAIVIMFIGIMYVGKAEAETQSSVYVGAWSKHLLLSDEHVKNEKHDLLAVEYNGWLGGRFTNTFGKTTFVLGKNFRYPLTQNIEVGLMAGATYGYASCYKVDYSNSSRVCPALVPSVSFNSQGTISPTVLLLGDALAVSIKVNF